MDIETFRKAGYQAIDRICDYYYSIASLPVLSRVEPGYLSKALPLEAPEKGEDFQNVADDYQKLILPGITHWQSPSFFAYFPSNATFPGILADLYASAVTNPGFNWVCSPACTELESIVMDWAAKLFGLSPAFHISTDTPRLFPGGGAIQGTASEAALVSLIAARTRFLAAHAHEAIPMEKLVIYVSSQTHSLGVKAGLMLGLRVRVLKVDGGDSRYALRGETMKQAYEEDRKVGLWPFALIATLGTTSSGAMDRIDELGPLVQTFDNFWLHVDAAWAGMALSCPEYREVCYLDAINTYVHCFCTNFHKWGLVNFDATAMWVRDRRYLTEALSVTPVFLRTKHSDAGTVIDYRNWQVGLGRRFRSVKIWFVLRTYGLEGFRAHIRKSVKLAEHFEALVRANPMFELAAPRSLALVVFRLVPHTLASAGHGVDATMATRDKINTINTEFHRRLTEGKHNPHAPPSPESALEISSPAFTNHIADMDAVLPTTFNPNDKPANVASVDAPTTDDDRLFLTRTDLNGVTCIRMSIGAERTQVEHIRRAFDILCRVGADVLKGENVGSPRP